MSAAPASPSTPLGSGAMFDGIAPRYDLLNRVMSAGLDQGWRRKLVAAVNAPPGASLLDLATGTADVAITLARVYPDARIVASDPSPGMLDVAREKLDALGLAERISRGKLDALGLAERISLELADAQALPQADATFDGATMAFGIRNVPDRAAALREMVRVVRPGGRVCILELGEPDSALARLHVHHIIPRLGALLSGRREYRYLQSSIAAFPPPEAFCDLMRASGLVDVTCQRLAFGAAHIFVGLVPQGT